MEELIRGERMLAPDAVGVTAREGFVLRVRFANGELRDFDAKPLLARKCYLRLCSEAMFRTARVEYGVVTWANGCDLDPEWLYEDSVPVERATEIAAGEALPPPLASPYSGQSPSLIFWPG